MKTRTFRHKNSKTRKSKKGGNPYDALAYAAKNPNTTAKALSAANRFESQVKKMGANLGNRLNQVKNSKQAQEAMNKMSTAKDNIQGNVNKAMNSEGAQKLKEELIKKKNKFSNMASTFMNSMNNRKKGGKKWSLKYKRSINCKRPKGFSQKQHCKYGRRKSRRTRKSRK